VIKRGFWKVEGRKSTKKWDGRKKTKTKTKTEAVCSDTELEKTRTAALTLTIPESYPNRNVPIALRRGQPGHPHYEPPQLEPPRSEPPQPEPGSPCRVTHAKIAATQLISAGLVPVIMAAWLVPAVWGIKSGMAAWRTWRRGDGEVTAR
jgi:hypothetical protein